MSDRELPIATEDLLQKILCQHCKYPLSVPPIRLIGNDYVCGRCPGDGFRIEPLEAFAKQFKYPCINQITGCDVILSWNEIAGHEQNCGFQTIKCFYEESNVKGCVWSGCKNEFKTHFENNHSNCILTRELILLQNQLPNATKNLCIVNDALLKAILANDHQHFICKFVNILSKFDMYMYKIDFFNQSTTLTFSRQCSVGFNIEKNTLKSVFSNLNNVYVKISVNTADKILSDNKTLSKFECPICLGSMRSEIYIAVCGHSVCNKCAPKLVKCPTCQKNDRFRIRNYTLESCRDSFV